MRGLTARTRRCMRVLVLVSIASAVLAGAFALPAAAGAAPIAYAVGPAAPGDTYTITPTVSGPGSVTPADVQTVAYLGSCTFYISPAPGYHANVTVDGGSRGDVARVDFTNVTENHTIVVTFLKDTHPIHATAGSGGSITPSGTVSVDEGSEANFTIVPEAGHHVADVLVDDVSVGPVTSYRFTNVQDGHTISATFALNTFKIVPSAGAHGSLSPGTTQTVTFGDDATFNITAAPGYHVGDVLVDGVSAGAVTTYTFHAVSGNHTIAATFEANPAGTYTITASAGGGGAIAPSGARMVTAGANATFTITPANGYHIQDVLVDGTSVGPVGTYTFAAVAGNHTIAATFAVDSADNAAPHTTCDAVASYSGTATIHLTAADEVGGSGVAHIWYKLDGGAPVEGAALTTSALGQHTLEYWAEDVAGNVESPHHNANFTVVDSSPVATSVTIAASPLTVVFPKPFVLSGVLKGGHVGDPCVVYVRKPASRYWSYSSKRLAYAADAAGAKWWYRYTPKLRGTYSFFVDFAGDPTRQHSRSNIITVRVK